jgi:hypothetical protein
VTALVGEFPGAPVTVTDVNLPVPAVLAPIFILSIVPVVVGFITTVPVPVGLIVTVALAGLNVVVPVVVNVLNVAARGVDAPITILSNDPVVLGLSVNELLTDKSGIGELLARLKESVFVKALVVSVTPFDPVIFNVFEAAFNDNVVCVGTVI